jgi:hypothetical protein
MTAAAPKKLEPFERKIRVDLTFWCTDERYIDDLMRMLKDASFNSENVTHGAYGFSLEIPEEEKLLKKLRQLPKD